MYDLIKLVPLLPLIGFATLGLFGNKIKKESIIGAIGSATVGTSFLILVYLFVGFLQSDSTAAVKVPVYDWITIGSFNIELAYQVDQLSLLFGMIITGIGFLIHVYSIGYMHGDRSFFRFFSYLNLFIFIFNFLFIFNYFNYNVVNL